MSRPIKLSFLFAQLTEPSLILITFSLTIALWLHQTPSVSTHQLKCIICLSGRPLSPNPVFVKDISSPCLLQILNSRLLITPPSVVFMLFLSLVTSYSFLRFGETFWDLFFLLSPTEHKKLTNAILIRSVFYGILIMLCVPIKIKMDTGLRMKDSRILDWSQCQMWAFEKGHLILWWSWNICNLWANLWSCFWEAMPYKRTKNIRSLASEDSGSNPCFDVLVFARCMTLGM